MNRFGADVDTDAIGKVAHCIAVSVNTNLGMIEAISSGYGKFVIAVRRTSESGLSVLTLDELKRMWMDVFDAEALTNALVSNPMHSLDSLIDRYIAIHESGEEVDHDND
jgi:maltoporin